MDFNIWTEPRSVWDVAPVLLVCFFVFITVPLSIALPDLGVYLLGKSEIVLAYTWMLHTRKLPKPLLL